MVSRTAMPPEMLGQVARTFQALSDVSRLAILQALMSGPKSVTEVVELTGKGQANVSKHLGVLADAALVLRTRKGTQALYEIADPMVHSLCDLVCGSVRARLGEQIKVNQRILKNT